MQFLPLEMLEHYDQLTDIVQLIKQSGQRLMSCWSRVGYHLIYSMPENGEPKTNQTVQCFEIEKLQTADQVAKKIVGVQARLSLA